MGVHRRITSYNVCYTKLLRAEHLDPAVPGIRDVDVSGGIHRDGVGKLHLAVPVPRGSPLRPEDAQAVEHLDPVVVGVQNVDVSGEVHGQIARILELPVPRSSGTPLGEELSLPVEFLDPPVQGVRDIDVAVTVRRDGVGVSYNFV